MSTQAGCDTEQGKDSLLSSTLVPSSGFLPDQQLTANLPPELRGLGGHRLVPPFRRVRSQPKLGQGGVKSEEMQETLKMFILFHV